MASKTKPLFESDWKVAVQFGVGDSVSPTGVADTSEHAGIFSTWELFHSDSK